MLGAVLLAAAVLATARLLMAAGHEPDSVLVDSEGQRYTIKRLPKKEIRYRKLADGWVRVAPYFSYRLEREDEQYLYVREYAPPARAAPTPALAAPAPAAPPPAVAPTLGQVDRLTLAPFSDGLPSTGQWRNHFALADLNGDGSVDLVHGPPRKGGGEPRVFLGDGSGHWRLWSDASYPPGAYDYGAVAVADFNGDGRLDIAAAAHQKGISVLLGDGQGRFSTRSRPADFEPAEADRFTTRALLARDWNRDGRPDLVALGEGPNRAGASSLGWVIYLNQENGRWQKHAQPAVPTRTFGDALAVGDFNGDGHDDLLTASLVMGNRDIVHYGGAQVRTVTVEALRPPSLVFSVASADFDGDGRDDLALGSLSREASGWQSLIEVLLAQPDGTWRRRTLHSVASRNTPYALGVGDVDGDGHKDLAALDDTGTLRLFLGDGAGNFALEGSPELPPLGRGCRGYHVALADLNRDRRDEIIAAFASEVSAMSGEPGCPGGGRLQAWTPTRKLP